MRYVPNWGQTCFMGPPRRGQPWTESDDLALALQWLAGSDLASIALTAGRTEGAIRSRLVRIGLATRR